ncbi:hypothetical protein HHI36_020911 [Cryptolaemus montrouzieri]|uniref:Uncharacterized protein n=1 Tax=Cryptolaemus montrouzieri TaxID=559131 RepID=A0ABD2NBR8_9CUCU
MEEQSEEEEEDEDSIGEISKIKKENLQAATASATRISHQISQNTSSIFVKNESDWVQVNQYLKDSEAEFHTYTWKNEKTHAFVLEGLDSELATDEIKEELKGKYQISVQQVFRMKNTSRPLYLVVTGKDIILKYLQKNAYIINYTKVVWKRHFNKEKLRNAIDVKHGDMQQRTATRNQLA